MSRLRRRRAVARSRQRNAVNPGSLVDSLSPVSLDDSTSERALVVDAQVRTLGGIFGDTTVGNGSGQWINWNTTDWRRLHSWINVGTRDLFWVQKDLGTFENEASLLP